MKQQYVDPRMDMITLNARDVITTSLTASNNLDANDDRSTLDELFG